MKYRISKTTPETRHVYYSNGPPVAPSSKAPHTPEGSGALMRDASTSMAVLSQYGSVPGHS